MINFASVSIRFKQQIQRVERRYICFCDSKIVGNERLLYLNGKTHRIFVMESSFVHIEATHTFGGGNGGGGGIDFPVYVQ